MRFLVCLLGAAVCLSAAGALSNRRAPGFSLPDSSFRQYDLNDYRGKIVLLDIMRTGCPDCQTLSATLEKAKARYGDKIAILSVVNPPDTQASVALYIKAHNITTPILFDCGQVAGSYLKATPQNPTIHVPHLFLIDATGFIRNDFGHSPESAEVFEGPGLFAEIDRLLEASGKQR